MRLPLIALLILPTASFAQEYVTVKDFYEKLGDAQSYISMKTMRETENQLMKLKETTPTFNLQYLMDDDTFFETNTDALIERSQFKTLVDARKELFRGLDFNAEEGNFKFIHPVLTHWDVLPHPPIQKLTHPIEYYTETYLPNTEFNKEMLSEKFNQELNDLTQSDVSFGNKVMPVENREVFIEMKKMIYEAKDYVLMSNMFATCDDSMMPILKVMESKVQEGVPVHMIVERVFALKYSSCLKKIKKAGVNLFYNDHMLKFKNRLVYHNKFTISDNKKALVMGANMFDAEIDGTGFNHMFRDSGMLLSGPVVTDLASEWLGLAQLLKEKKSDRLLTKLASQINSIKKEEEAKSLRGIKFLKEKKSLDGMCRVVIQAPHKSSSAMNDLYSKIISTAQKSVFVTTPRLPEDINNPEDQKSAKIFKSMHERAGIDKNFKVDVLTNNKLVSTDVKSVNFTQTGFMTKLYKMFVKMEDTIAVINNVRSYFGGENKLDNFTVWNYFQFHHAKVLLADNTLYAVGSYNVNKTSDDTSFEMSVVCHDKAAIQEAQKYIVRDLINSVPILE